MTRNTKGGDTVQAAPNPAASQGAAFWRFSLALYARPGVADALIALQDRAGLDINLVLFGLWAGARYGYELGGDGFAAAAESVAGLSGVVRDIRTLRVRLGGELEADLRHLRRAVLRLELATERRVQTRLAGCFAAGAPPRAQGDRHSAAHANLTCILGNENGSPEAVTLRNALAALTRRA